MLIADDPVLRVGDRIRIVCPDVPELCVDRSVSADGTVSLPGLGELPAVSRRMGELTKRVFDELPTLRRAARVEIRWLGPDPRTITVSGAVQHSLTLFAPRGVLLDRLLGAAQPTPDADLALLPRGGRLPPGSTLEVPSVTVDRRISILGGVASPRALAPALNLVLSSALAAAGGLTAHADRSHLVVVRSGESIPVTLPEDAGFLLQPGDVVRVGLIAERRYVTVIGLVARPGTVEYAPGLTATQALEAAGGLVRGVTDGTLIWQTGPKTFRLSLAFLLNRRIPDPVLGPNDSLTVAAGKP